MTDSYTWFVGIDWGYQTHQICLLDAAAQLRDTRRVDHDHTAVDASLTCLERGFAVYAINPKQLDRFRDRYTAAGAKDDRRDAQVLADALRTDRAAFHRVPLEDALVVQLRELARLEDDCARDLSRLTHQLRDQVYRIAPPLLRLCPAADEPWFWPLLEAAPTPAEQQRLTRTQILTLLKTHRIRRLTADDVRAALRAQLFPLAPGVVEATRDALQLLIEHLRFVTAQRARCARQQEALLDALRTRPASEAEPGEHRDVEILASLPGVGRMTTVAVLTAATQPLATRDYDALRAHIGSAPITKASGKRRLVQMRRACNRRLREAAYHWGRVSLQQDAATAAYYKQLRARGQTHGRALRSVVDRWLRILVAMLRHRTLYDPTRSHIPVAVPA